MLLGGARATWRCSAAAVGQEQNPDPRSCNPRGISDPQHLSPILVPAQSFPFLVLGGAAGVRGRRKESSRGQTNWFYFLMALCWCLVGIQQKFPAVTCCLLFYLIAGRERESKEMAGGYWGCSQRSTWECNCFLFAGLYLLVQFEQGELNQRCGLLSTAIWMWYAAGLTVTEGFYRTGDARGKCRSSARCWPRYCCTNVVPVRLCHEFFSISTKPAAQLHTGNKWGETRRQQWRLSNGCMWQEGQQRREKVLGTRSRQPRGDGAARSIVKLWHFLGFLLGWSHLCWEVEFNSVWWCLNKICCAVSFVSFLFFFSPFQQMAVCVSSWPFSSFVRMGAASWNSRKALTLQCNPREPLHAPEMLSQVSFWKLLQMQLAWYQISPSNCLHK